MTITQPKQNVTEDDDGGQLQLNLMPTKQHAQSLDGRSENLLPDEPHRLNEIISDFASSHNNAFVIEASKKLLSCYDQMKSQLENQNIR